MGLPVPPRLPPPPPPPHPLRPCPSLLSPCPFVRPCCSQHWQDGETDFLYTEIFGHESAYCKDDKVLFGPGATIVDAGANIGMFTLFAAQQCRGDATIYSFEPIPSTYSVLDANARAANAGAFSETFKPAPGASLRVTALNRGLSNAPLDTTFEHHPNFSVWSTQDASFAHARLERIAADLPRAVKNIPVPRCLVSLVGRLVLRKLGRTERVPVSLVTLSSVIESHAIGTIDVLKVDVEGAEIAVLEGIADKHWQRVQQVVLEVESFAHKDKVIAMLEARGFACSWFASERERNEGVLSEVCMVYARRPEYKGVGTGTGTAAKAGGKAGAAASK